MAIAWSTLFLSGFLTISVAPNQRILVRRVRVTSQGNARIDVVTDPDGTPVAIGPALFTRWPGRAVLDVRFEREPLVGQVGKKVSLLTATSAVHSLLVEYVAIG